MKCNFKSLKAAICFCLVILIAPICVVQTCGAYSVLTHEEIVDLTWKDTLLPLLKKRFPAATDDDLKFYQQELQNALDRIREFAEANVDKVGTPEFPYYKPA